MKVQPFPVGLLALLAAAGLLASCAQNDPKARAYAETILKMKDRGQYRDLYREQFDAKMQRAMSEDRWTRTAQNLDRTVGPLSSRELESSGYGLLCSCYKFRYKVRYQSFQGFDELYISTEGDHFKVSGLWLKKR